MGGKCVLRAQKKVYKNTLGARILQTGFGLVTILTPQSHRMAEAGGDLWGPPAPSLHPGAQGGAFPPPRCPQDPELTISWPLQPELPWIFSLGSAEPLCHLRRNLSPTHSRSLLDCSCPAELPLQQGSGWFKSPTRSGACKSARSNLRLLLCVEGLILFFSH